MLKPKIPSIEIRRAGKFWKEWSTDQPRDKSDLIKKILQAGADAKADHMEK